MSGKTRRFGMVVALLPVWCCAWPAGDVSRANLTENKGNG